MGLLVFIAVLLELIFIPVASIVAIVAMAYKVAFVVTMIVLVALLLLSIATMIGMFKCNIYGSKAQGTLDANGKKKAKYWIMNIIGLLHLISIIVLVIVILALLLINCIVGLII